ncbi:MAG: acyl-ACP--UDP-N-acetylglucosamine O-acyltransferase [Pirellulales bacterium]
MNIHPMAIVSSQARLGRDVVVGPYAIIEDDVEIGDGTSIGAHSVVKNGSKLGCRNDVSEHVVIGGAPQHLKKNADLGRLVVGDGNTIREYSSLHRAMKPDHVTTVGNDNFFMAGTHVAHDCTVGSNITCANNVLFGGHVIVEDRAFVSGAVGVHQFCRIGTLAMVGGHTKIVQDVPPFTMVDNLTSCVVGLNLVGLRRNGYTTEQIAELKLAYRTIYRRGLKWSDVLEQLKLQFPTGPASRISHVPVGRHAWIRARTADAAARHAENSRCGFGLD